MDASFTVAIAARTSVDARRKDCSETAIKAAGTEKSRSPSNCTISLALGIAFRTSNSDVPCGSGVGLLPTLGLQLVQSLK